MQEGRGMLHILDRKIVDPAPRSSLEGSEEPTIWRAGNPAWSTLPTRAQKNWF